MEKDEMEAVEKRITARKAELDAMRPLSPDLLPQLQKHYDVNLTYSSNAIEGNQLTLRETAEVIEHGITVGGKRLRDHLEAADHYDAIQWMREKVSAARPITEATVTELHRRIVLRSNPEIAGIYSTFPRRIAGSAVIFPNPAKLPALMRAFGEDLDRSDLGYHSAFDAHYRLTAIHPFSDGNGRTARLLMNLMLLRSGHPPVAIRPEDRAEYLASLERASTTEDLTAYRQFMGRRLAETLDEYVDLFREAGIDGGVEVQHAAWSRQGRER
jgi:Fic family protein